MDESKTRVGIYARLSDDRDGQQTATARQIEDCRAHVERRGWQVADIFEDIDTSAFSKRAKRPQFERMLAALSNGDVAGVVVWKLDRLTRQQRDLVRVMEASEVNGAFVASVMEPIDTRDSMGQFVAELLVAQARMESANTSTRQTRKHDELAKQGRPLIGGFRTYGYNRDRTAIVEEEAALLREAVDRLLAGESLRGVCRDWQKRGVTTTSGGAWQPTSLRRSLGSAAISGQRERDGQFYKGSWEAIISPETTRRLRTIFSDPSRRLTPGSARKYLLSGFLYCSQCGEKLEARPRVDKVRRYVCTIRAGTRACGAIAILAEPLEELVFEMVMAAIDEGELGRILQAPPTSDEGVLDVVRRDEEALTDLARDFYVERVISKPEFLATRNALNARLEASRSVLARESSRGVLAGYIGAGDKLRTGWAGGSLDWRRAVIAAVIDRVTISHARKGRHPFDPSRVVPTWRN